MEGYGDDSPSIRAFGLDVVTELCQRLLANGAPGEWNSSESGHPGLFEDDDGQLYMFYQGNNDHGRTWFLSWVKIGWDGDKPRVIQGLAAK